jgi:hypothetical protein
MTVSQEFEHWYFQNFPCIQDQEPSFSYEALKKAFEAGYREGRKI